MIRAPRVSKWEMIKLKCRMVFDWMKRNPVLSILIYLVGHVVVIDFILFFVLLRFSSTIFSCLWYIDFGATDLGLPKMIEYGMPDSFLMIIHSGYALFVRELMARLSVIEPTQQGEMQRLNWDVSSHGEFSIIWKHIQEHQLTVSPTIIDVGAMDGLSNSNSFNFIQQGWQAVLCEPFPRHQRRIRENLRYFLETTSPTVRLWPGAVAVAADPCVPNNYERVLCLFNEASKTSNAIACDAKACRAAHFEKPLQSTVEVPAVPPRVFFDASERDRARGAFDPDGAPAAFLASLGSQPVPERFGVLTVDAEGYDKVIIEEFLKAGARPSFIIGEENLNAGQQELQNMLRDYGYAPIAFVGANLISVLRQ